MFLNFLIGQQVNGQQVNGAPTSARSATAGPVLIGYPFGIGRNCSAIKWFNVDCNSSIPYLSAFNNMEVLRAEKRRVTVNTSVIKVDCKNPILHSNISHGKSPFLLSGLNNILVVEGCGGAAIMENRSIVAGCSTTCGNNTISDLNYCFGVGCCNTVIPHDLQSFTLNLTGSTSNGRETCGSALLVDTDSFMNERVSRQFVVEDHTFVPISLSWNHNTTECNNTCGEVMIPYPFGIGKSCSQDNWYNVDCNSSTPYLSAFNNIQVLGVNIESQTVTGNFSKISDCEKPVQNNYSILQSTTPFVFQLSITCSWLRGVAVLPSWTSMGLLSLVVQRLVIITLLVTTRTTAMEWVVAKLRFLVI